MIQTGKKYKHIFFDLDKTLWDFEKNAHEAYQDIFDKFSLQKKGITNLGEFLKVYFVHNENLWEHYRNGLIEKSFLRSERFRLTLLNFGINDAHLARMIGDEYVAISPLKTNLFPNARQVLSYLQTKYTLHIITNGFDEVQHPKLMHSELDVFFDQVITSEDAGCKKPAPEIFTFALQKAGANASESLMIGDDPEVDVAGAISAGMDAILFNPKNLNPNGYNFEQISDLIQLKHRL
jgi:putative hydrolase of the HAD superfamily